MLQDTACNLLSRNTPTHLEEREKKDEPGEAASERWHYPPLRLDFALTNKYIVLAPVMFVPLWGWCIFQELAGGVSGQRLQQQHCIHRSLLRGPVCRGNLHHHRRTLWPDSLQTLNNKGTRWRFGSEEILIGGKKSGIKSSVHTFFVGRKGNHDRRHVPGAGASPT